ncbi:potassium/sodium hyperpolarization-activated cyclic nucleotide-gated channel 1-like isoform X2 [Dermacentor albipictus]|uniref:potassium/sodium hyperpolarization-activated cyclic nucleotide-gated channel 1-like isoform X2 n=1 Tax=Dermacentor albipictus TaxID=60249 RepID=UPI0038FC5012
MPAAVSAAACPVLAAAVDVGWWPPVGRYGRPRGPAAVPATAYPILGSPGCEKDSFALRQLCRMSGCLAPSGSIQSGLLSDTTRSLADINEVRLVQSVMGRKRKRSRRRSKSGSRRTRRSAASQEPLPGLPSQDTQALSSSNQTRVPSPPDQLQEAPAADETQVKWAREPVHVPSSPDQSQALSSVEQPNRDSKCSKSSKASKASRASHGVSWGEARETDVQSEDADVSPDPATSRPLWDSAAPGETDSERPTKEIDKDVERRLVAMFKRQLKTFLFPPMRRQGFVFPLDHDDKSILDGRSIREERHFPWMIHPKTTFRNAWDLCMLVMSFASLILVPLNVAYFEPVQEERVEWRIFNIASDLLFFADVIFNFRTGVHMKEDHGRINMDPEYVAVQYRRGWFYVDSFCCLPLDYTAMVVLRTGDAANDPSTTSAYPSILRINKLLALPKIGRLTTIIRNIADVEENFFVYSKGVYVRLLFHLGLVFLLIHWHGCLQYYVDRLEGFPTNSWVARLELVIRDLDDYMQYKMLPLNLRRRIRDYAENRFKGRVFDEGQIIQSLSDPLRERVMWHNCRRILRNVPFFARAEPDFLRDLVASMKIEFFIPNEVVAAAGTMGDRLYLLQSGSAHVVDSAGITVAAVMPGDRFGEVCLLHDTLRLRTVIADRYCHFFSLTRADFNEVLARHPDVHAIVDEILTERSVRLSPQASPDASEDIASV